MGACILLVLVHLAPPASTTNSLVTEPERPPLKARASHRTPPEADPARARREQVSRGLLIGGGTLLAAGSATVVVGAGIGSARLLNDRAGDGTDLGARIMIGGAVVAGLGLWTTIAGAIVRRRARSEVAPVVSARFAGARLHFAF